jgi:2,4-dienoyl-CoA reductase (NADPH2)
MFTPKALSSSGVEQTISDFVRCAELASEAGYDGVEVMGSEGYLINQFIALEANKRTDEWGGSYENRECHISRRHQHLKLPACHIYL